MRPKSVDLRLENCEFREPSQSADVAICRLLGRVLDVSDAELCLVQRDACLACCRSMRQPERINPVIASLVYSARADLLFMTGGFPDHHLLAIKPDGRGNVTNSKIIWRTNKGVAYVPSPLVEGDYLLIVSDSGVAHCFEAATGKLLWQERLGDHHASLVSAKGLVYFLNDDGVTHIVKPGAAFNLVARNEIGEKCFASPAISRGQIFLRGTGSLFCAGAK